MLLTNEPIALRQPDGALWRLLATLWLTPDDDETALAGAGYIGEAWPRQVLEFLGGAEWGGFASEDPEFHITSFFARTVQRFRHFLVP